MQSLYYLTRIQGAHPPHTNRLPEIKRLEGRVNASKLAVFNTGAVYGYTGVRHGRVEARKCGRRMESGPLLVY